MVLGLTLNPSFLIKVLTVFVTHARHEIVSFLGYDLFPLIMPKLLFNILLPVEAIIQFTQ
jgi:hypothetical protein